jgi:hypothetical protein
MHSVRLDSDSVMPAYHPTSASPFAFALACATGHLPARPLPALLNYYLHCFSLLLLLLLWRRDLKLYMYTPPYL